MSLRSAVRIHLVDGLLADLLQDVRSLRVEFMVLWLSPPQRLLKNIVKFEGIEFALEDIWYEEFLRISYSLKASAEERGSMGRQMTYSL